MKYIFLDENIWIDICRFENKEHNAPDLSSVFPILAAKVDKGEWAFPLSLEHIEETQGTLSQVRRQKLVSTMMRISKGYTIKNYLGLADYEIGEFLADRRSWETPYKVITHDPGNAVYNEGFRGRFEATLAAEGIKEGTFRYSVAQDLYSQMIEKHNPLGFIMMQPHKLDEDKAIYLAALEWMRKNGGNNELQFIASRLRDYYTDKQRFYILLRICKMKLTNDKSENQKQLRELLQRLPTFYTNSILTYKNGRMQPKDKPLHKNDYFDIMHLSAMLPYCDIVITEKKWVNLAKQAKLDKIYNTKLLSDIRLLPNILL